MCFLLENVNMRNEHYLIWIYSIVDWPGCLEIFEHPLLELLGQVMNTYEVLQILSSSVVEGPSGIHPLYDRCHISKHQGMHQGWKEWHNVNGREEIWWRSLPLPKSEQSMLIWSCWYSYFSTSILVQPLCHMVHPDTIILIPYGLSTVKTSCKNTQ